MALAIGDYSLGWTTADSARDETDVAALVAEFSPLLYRVAFSLLRHSAEAEDVVQETFLRVLEHRAKLSSVREMRPWLARIAWNLALDRKRRVQPEQMDEIFAAELASPEHTAEQSLAGVRELRAVLAVMERLPQSERDVLLLSAVEELSTAEMAAVLKKSESGVRSLLFRARAHLQQRMEDADKRPRGARR